jgi:hypothetical protein
MSFVPQALMKVSAVVSRISLFRKQTLFQLLDGDADLPFFLLVAWFGKHVPPVPAYASLDTETFSRETYLYPNRS